ncbi:TonB-dependent receptor [Iningainema sp. BLCCT55]|uniref:TonB-dependent receptor n=2 Tax=Iningainema TaxID=1932705 RepID=A0A8J6XBI4_9CYAN|nr:TonB-dependent receptor [Iningainema tapete BLCC-T55]
MVSSLTVCLLMLYEGKDAIAQGAAAKLIAQTIPAPTDQQEPDIELTVTGEILNQPVYSPFRREGTVKDSTRPIYVITKEEIEAQGAKTIREALRFLPGILPDGTVGTEVNALSGQFIRGSNTSQVLILLDGRPINNLGSGGFDLSEITTDNVERVEVLPGGGSTLYGSDAIGGVINIITRRPTEKVTTSAKVIFGAYGLNQQSIQNSGKAGDISWVVGYNRTEAQYNYPFSIPEANFEGTRKNNDVLYNNFNIKLEANLDSRNTLALSTLYLSKEQGVPGGVPVLVPEFGQGYFNRLTDNNRKYTDQVLTDLTWNSKLGNGNDSLLTARVYADFLNTRFDNLTLPLSSQQRFDNKQNSYGIQTQHSWKFAKNQTLVYGFDYRNVSARNSTFSYFTNQKTVSYDDSISQGALFARYEINFTPGFAVNLGLRQDFNSLANGSFTSPSVGARWAISDSTTIRANYIRNFRVPTLFDLYAQGSTFVGNPNLRPENGDSYDVGIDQKFGDIGLLRLTFFSNTISDLIAYNFAVPIATFENIGLVRTRGIEAALNLQLAKNVYAFVNYTLNDPRILKSTNPAEVDNELRFAGADNLNIGISYENPQGLYLGLIMHSLGSYPTNNTNTESLPGYTTIDVKTRVPLSDNIVLTGSVDNIFNQRYQLFSGYPDAGRLFQVGINATF